MEKQSSLSSDVQVFQRPLRSTQSLVGDLRPDAESQLDEDLSVRSPTEQKFHSAQVRQHAFSLHIWPI